ncbi:extracellular solute-binding protein [Zavarzinia sp. CC-PAN008]|uniref:extracellular solute-binding protein n=1 Tax=Zavarzinia sp. CC-PAN008 TaxID=3243332 RepID=UPI003F746998
MWRLLAFLFVLGCGPALAEPQAGIAMHGTPKYAAGFDHFDYAVPDAPKGGELRLAASGTFDSLNPFIVRGLGAAGLNTYVYDSLMARSWDEPFSLYGYIAETIDTPPDRSQVTFRLRPQARWHDGRPITAADVLFSWATLRDKGRPNHRGYYSGVVEATSPDPLTVTFRFEPGSDRELPLIMGLMPILPAHVWTDRAFDQTTMEPPLGSGPYRVARVDPGRSITYERVADHWARDLPVMRGLFNFDRIRIDYFRDESVSLEAFLAGAYDFRREPDPGRWATGYATPAVRSGRIVLEELPTQRTQPYRALIFNTRRPVFADSRVRRALTLAFDFDWINATLFHGAYRRSTSYFPNSELAASGPPTEAERALLARFSATLPAEATTQAFDLPGTGGQAGGMRPMLRQATRLLAEAGYSVRAGTLVDAAGQPYRFEILLNEPALEKVALAYANALAKLGITVRVTSADAAQFQTRLNAFDYDMVLHGWTSSLSPGNEQMVYWSSRAADQPGSRNYPGIRDPAVDALAASLGATQDRADLVNRVRAMDRALLWGWWSIPLWHPPADRVAYWARLQHPTVTPLYGLVLETWWAKPD